MLSTWVQVDPEALAEVCVRYGVTRLRVFGSAVTDRFDPARSDVDVLVDYAPEAERTFSAFFSLQDELAVLFGRSVDVVDARTVRNPYFAASLRSAEDLYAA